MTSDRLQARYQEMQKYVGWTSDDARRVVRLQPIFADHISELIDDFYAEIQQHADTVKVISGGRPQITQVKKTLRAWLEQLLSGEYGDAYFQRRWQAGWRHVEIGLDLLYTCLALARLRDGMFAVLAREWAGSQKSLTIAMRSLNKLLDMDLAIIQDAYAFECLQREREVERKRGEQKMRNLVETADCMIVILRPNHKIAYFSPYAEILTGYEAVEVLNEDSSLIFVAREDGRGILRRVESVLDGEPLVQVEGQVRCRDGSYCWLIWNARRIDDYEEGPTVLAVGYDITELKQANEKLLQANRLATIGEMSARLAHESRNALQRLRVCTEMLEFEVDENVEAMRLIARSQKAQDDLQRLFDEVRSYASPFCMDQSPCRLSSLWQEAWNLLHYHRNGREAELTVDCGESDLGVTVDRFRLVQLFRNIFENSLAACPDPTRIHIRCRDTALGNDKAVEIRIQDNGPGLDGEAMRRVFEPFYTTKTMGTGLGLAIARRIVDAHGGKISVAEEAAQGAEFILVLPRQPPE